MNFGRKTMKAGVAAVAAIATLGAGGVVASTATPAFIIFLPKFM